MILPAGKPLKGPSHLEKSGYIRGGCVSLNAFDATDYESALRFSEKKTANFEEKFISNFE